MKLHDSDNKVITGGAISETEFTIKATAHSFKILSDGLYSDKIRAVVRELSANAWDAHIFAGKADKPIQITLPSALNPIFEVYDEGPGLTHDEVYELYTTYFASTKSDSNKFVGALGLGSKSPFAYNPAFSVISRCEGKKRSYSAFLNDHGIPSISLMGEENWSGPTGMTISMPVKNKDIETFASTVRDTLIHFTPLPKVKGRANFEFPEREIIMERKDWRAFKTVWESHYGGSHHSHKTYAIQGNIRYGIELSSLQEQFGDSDPILRKWSELGATVELDFPIGELDPTASREALSYDKRTCQNLYARMKKVYKELSDEASKQVASCKTYWEACCKGSQLYKFITINMEDVYWKGQRLTKEFQLGRTTGMSHGAVVKPFYKYKVDLACVNHWTLSRSIKSFKLEKEHSNNSYFRIETSDANVFMVVDDAKYLPSRIKLWYDKNYRAGSSHNTPTKNLGSVILLYPSTETHYYDPEKTVYRPGQGHTSTPGKKIKKVGGWRKYLKDLGDPPYILTSTLPEYTPPKRAARSGKINGYYLKPKGQYKYYRGGYNQEMLWDAQEVDITEGGTYLELYGMKPYIDGISISKSSLLDIMDAEKSAFGASRKFVGVPQSYLKPFKASNLWEEYRTVVEMEIDGVMKKSKKAREQQANLETIELVFTHNECELIKAIAYATNKQIFTNLRDNWIKAYKGQGSCLDMNVSQIQKLAKLLSIDIEEVKGKLKRSELEATRKQIFKRYPLLTNLFEASITTEQVCRAAIEKTAIQYVEGKL